MFIFLPETSSDPKYSAHTEVVLLRDTSLQGRTLKWALEGFLLPSAHTVPRGVGDK